MKILVIGSTVNTGIAAIHALTKEGHEVVGTDERKLVFNIHSRYTKPYYMHLPFSDNNFHKDILSIIEKEKPDVVLPVKGTQNISLHKEEIKKHTNLLVPDYESFISAYDKTKTYKICVQAGISVPERFTDVDADYFLQSEKNSILVIKPDYDEGGAHGLKYVSTIGELEAAKRNIKKNFGRYVIEEFIPGALTMRSIRLLFDKKNKLIAYFIFKKIRQLPITGGVMACAESTNEMELLNFVLPFFEKCPWEGPVEVELIIDERDGQPKLIEINPRFGGNILFPIQCGINFPNIAVNAAVNKNTAEIPPAFNAGEFYINFSYYLKAVLKEFNLAKNKTAFLYQVFTELKRKRVSSFPDKKDFVMHLAKIWMEITS